MAQNQKQPWRVAIAGGDTFTDAIAFAADGTCRRLKVLAHGALRARIAAVLDAQTLLLDTGLPPADGLWTGFELRLLRTTGGFARIRATDASGRVRLGHPLDDAQVGDLCELASGWDAATLAVHAACGSADAAAAAVLLPPAPQGGMAAAATLAHVAGLTKAIALDIGGATTTIAWLRAGTATAATVVTLRVGGGIPIAATAGRLALGSNGMGSQPGPACYGAGGPLTVTDAHLLLGRLDAQCFCIPVCPAAAHAQALALAEALARPADYRELLEAALSLVDAQIVAGIRTLTTRVGCEPATAALVAFGSTGPLHALGIAEQLEMRTVLIPSDAGILGAAAAAAAAGITLAPQTTAPPPAATPVAGCTRIAAPFATTWIPPGWRVRSTPYGAFWEC